MESVSDDRQYFWHIFFGMAGCNNGVTFLNASTIPAKMSAGTFLKAADYKVSGARRNKLYLLCDDIYSKSPLSLHISSPSDDDQSYLSSRKEGRRKDIERAFGVLQA